MKIDIHRFFFFVSELCVGSLETNSKRKKERKKVVSQLCDTNFVIICVIYASFRLHAPSFIINYVFISNFNQIFIPFFSCRLRGSVFHVKMEWNKMQIDGMIKIIHKDGSVSPGYPYTRIVICEDDSET